MEISMATKFQRRHYEKIAEVIGSVKARPIGNSDWTISSLDPERPLSPEAQSAVLVQHYLTIETVIAKLEKLFEDDNPNWKPQRFKEAVNKEFDEKTSHGKFETIHGKAQA